MAFSYTGSALNSLVDGLTNNAAPVVTCLNDVKTWLNGANVDDANLVSPNNSAYRTVVARTGAASGATTGSTFGVSATSWDALTTVTFGPTYLDPADWTVAGKTTKMRLRVELATNATAPTSTFTFGLYPITASAGGAGVLSLTAGAVTAGSTVAFVAPSASTLAQANSGDFTAPSAGYFIPAVAVTVASQAANSKIGYALELQTRNV